MEHFISQLGDFLRDHQVWAGPIIAVLMFGESMVLIGMLVPGTATMMVMGSLIGGGVVHPVPVIAGAVIGSVLGDIVSYYLGRRLGSRVIYKWPLNKYRGAVARARLYFWKYAFAAVFFGRFIGPLRCTVPLVAGMRGMKQKSFQLANVVSAVAWVPVVLAPGLLAAMGADWIGATSGSDMVLFTLLFLGVSIVFGVLVIRFLSKDSGERRRGRAARVKPAAG